MNLVLIILLNISFNRVFLHPHCKYTRPIGGSGFNHLDGREFQ